MRLPIWTRDYEKQICVIYNFEDRKVHYLSDWDVLRLSGTKEFIFDTYRGQLIYYVNKGQYILQELERAHFYDIVNEESFINDANNYKPEPLKEGQMNKSTAIFLVDNNVKALKASYDDSDNGKTVKTFKTLDNFEKDDLIVVPTNTRHGFTVCKVVEFGVDIDFDSAEEVKWVVCKVDKDLYEQVKTQEEGALKKIQAAQVNKKKQELLDALKIDPTTIPQLTFNSDSTKVA